MAEEELSTKEKIIKASFSLLRNQAFGTISLSKIAKEVNISKTAIYRHFENKEALEIALRKQIYDDILCLFKKVDTLYFKKEYDLCIYEVLSFMNTYPEYLTYDLFSTPKLGEDVGFAKYKDAGIKFFSGIFDENHKILDFDFYISSLFVICTMVVFMLVWNGSFLEASCSNKIGLTFEQYKNQILLIIKKGFSFSSSELSAKSISKINTACLSTFKELPPLDKKLVALGNVVNKVGLQNVTVEAIADELGMVKSSLYTWFSDKSEMIRSLISPEINMMLECVLKTARGAEGPVEKLYALFKSETLYFITRKEMFSAYKWIQISGNYVKYDNSSLVEKKISEMLKKEIGKVFEENARSDIFSLDQDFVMGWLFTIPVFLSVNGIYHEFSDVQMKNALLSLCKMAATGLSFGGAGNIENQDSHDKKGGKF